VSEYRQENRRRWATGAQGWEANAAAMRRDTMPVSMWMVEAIAPQPGHTILDIAAGIGDTGFLAAELIEPGGTLITSDLVPEMLSAAQRRAESLGLTNVRFKQIDAEAIDLPAASLDGVLCRWGYMLMADPEAALRDTRRILKPDARVALAAWTDTDANPWTTLPIREVMTRGLAGPPAPGPGQFAWDDQATVADTLDAAGFIEHEIHALDFTVRYPSVERWWQTTRELSGRVRDATAGLDGDTEAEIVAALGASAAEWTAADGSLELPARTWVAAATA
jgi:SAM-dependent methyltransferase